MVSGFDTVVIGGGAVGAACAWELASTGRKVLIVEQGGHAGQAWRAAAGMLAPQIETGAGDPLLRLGLAGRDHYAGLAASLRESVGVDLGLWRASPGWPGPKLRETSSEARLPGSRSKASTASG
jgi:glycine oxidase